MENNTKRWIKTIEEFNSNGYSWSSVRTVSAEELASYPDAETAAISEGDLIRSSTGTKVYVITNNKRKWIQTLSAFNAAGYKWEDVRLITEEELNNISEEGAETARIKLIKLPNDPRVYYITQSNLKRHIPTAEIFNSYGNKWEEVVEVSETELNAYPDSTLIKLETGFRVYLLENNIKRWIKTAEAFNRLGYDWTKIAPVNETEFGFYEEGGIVE